jgi:hypothetical protein
MLVLWYNSSIFIPYYGWHYIYSFNMTVYYFLISIHFLMA